MRLASVGRAASFAFALVFARVLATALAGFFTIHALATIKRFSGSTHRIYAS
jgi:hypothetical protein